MSMKKTENTFHFYDGLLYLVIDTSRVSGGCILCIENRSDGTEKNMILIDRDLCRVV